MNKAELSALLKTACNTVYEAEPQEMQINAYPAICYWMAMLEPVRASRIAYTNKATFQVTLCDRHPFGASKTAKRLYKALRKDTSLAMSPWISELDREHGGTWYHSTTVDIVMSDEELLGQDDG